MKIIEHLVDFLCGFIVCQGIHEIAWCNRNLKKLKKLMPTKGR